MNYDSTLDVGDEVPGFDLDSTMGKIFFREYIQGKWCLLVTLGGGFEPVGTTDIGVLCRLNEELQSRNIFLLLIAKETTANLRVWIKDIEDIQTVKVNFAIMSDTDCHVLKIFGCARKNLVSKRVEPVSAGAFLIDLDNRIRFSTRSSLNVGRNWYELIRQFDALMLTTFHPVATPSNWGQGQQVLLKKEVDTKDAPEYRGLEIRSWFRLTACPDKY